MKYTWKDKTTMFYLYLSVTLLDLLFLLSHENGQTKFNETLHKASWYTHKIYRCSIYFFHHFKIAAICKIYDFLFGFHGKTGKENSMQLLGSYKFISTLQNTILGSVGRCRCIILANIKITAYIFEHLLQFHEFLK